MTVGPFVGLLKRFQVSPATASKWAARYRAGAPMTDMSSCPRRAPGLCTQRLERRIVKLRYCRRWGPHRIAHHLGVPRSTVGRVLQRYRMPLLTHIDQATGLPVRKSNTIRYEATAPGDLVHVDIKKQGRIPDGGGHRTLGQQAGKRNKIKAKGVGYEYRHHTVDDHSRFAYSEILRDERKETAAADRVHNLTGKYS